MTGQSPVVDTSATQIGNTFERQAAVGAADVARLLLAAGAVAGGADESHRRRRQHQRHAAGLHRLWHDRPGARDLRRHQRHGEHRRVRQLPRRRRHGGSADQHAAHSAEASTPGVQTQFISKSGGNQFRGTFFGGYSPEKLAGVQHRRRSDRARPDGGGGLEPEDVNRSSSYQDQNVGLRRLRDQGSPVVVRLNPAPGHQGALRQLPGQAADDDPEQLQRQGHLQPVAPTTSSSATRSRRRRSSRSGSTRGCSASTPASTPRKRRRGTRTSGRGCTRANGTAC